MQQGTSKMDTSLNDEKTKYLCINKSQREYIIGPKYKYLMVIITGTQMKRLEENFY